MGYVTVDEARDEGVPVSITDDAIQAQIDRWSSLIDKACRQWFEPREVTIDLDGNDSRLLHLPVPVIELTALYMNGDFTNAIPADRYKVYNNANAIRDDRKNPKIEIATAGVGIFDFPRFSSSQFVRGTQNQRLVGTFGYCEPAEPPDDPTTPPLIKYAVMKMVCKSLSAAPTGLYVASQTVPPAGLKVSETTDGHSISFEAFKTKPTPAGTNPITGDREVDGIIVMYKGPMLITTQLGRQADPR